MTKHAERRLRSRSGWPRRAIARAAETLTTEGKLIASSSTGEVILHRGLRWVLKEGRVLTVLPGEGRGSQ